MMSIISFDQKDIYLHLDAASVDELDKAEFGIVRLGSGGRISYMNRYEATLAKLKQEETMGKHFFTQVAPCTNNFLVAEKYKAEAGSRDETIDYIFTYRVKPTKVKLRLLTNPQNQYQYLLVKRRE
ncbi:MAG: PAS domain-containing protein [Bacteroidota bacterium]